MGNPNNSFLDEVCKYRDVFKLIFYGLMPLLLLQLIYLLVLDPSSGTFVISVFNVVGISVFLVVFGYLIRYCAVNH